MPLSRIHVRRATIPPMTTARLRLVALCVAVLSVVGVVVGVVATGRDERITDALAVVAVAALVIAWRLHRRSQHEPVAD
jgi:hypothetical protein